MIVKEWTREEVDKAIEEYGGHDAVVVFFQGLRISRFKMYRWAMSFEMRATVKMSLHNFNEPSKSVFNEIKGGHGELFGYPIAIDNSVDGLIFEEYA